MDMNNNDFLWPNLGPFGLHNPTFSDMVHRDGYHHGTAYAHCNNPFGESTFPYYLIADVEDKKVQAKRAFHHQDLATGDMAKWQEHFIRLSVTRRVRSTASSANI